MIATMQGSKYENRLFLTPRVPQGLAAAVEGLTREVIRQRPENIYVFAAHHFENLLKMREQYDYVGTNNSNKDTKILQDMNDAIKEREISAVSRNDKTSGWSLNETVKVLERHRSIFGETGQKMSTEQVRELANAKISNSSPKRKSEQVESQPRRRNVKCTGNSVNFSQSDAKHVPKIISQIPIAKDIKTELKKNRISSRERKKIEEKRMQVACEYSRETSIDKSVKKSVERTKRSSYESRSEQRKSFSSWRTEEREECTSSKRKSETSPKVTKMSSTSRSVSMDSVKNYVVQNFASMASLDELQSPSYVEKVQEVIDETSTIIQEKLEALKTGVRKASKKQSKTERSSASDDSNKDSGSSDNSARNAADAKEQSAEPTEPAEPESKNSEHSIDSSSESKISLPAVRPPSSKSTSRSQSARSDSDGLILPPISPESTKSPKVKEELVLPVLSPPRSSVPSPEVSLDTINLDEKNETFARADSPEEYHDSLNVTPDLLDAPPRPDSLENPEVLELGGQDSPLETLKDKLLEIEQVQKRIEGVLDETVSNEDNEDKSQAVINLNIQDKLLEIEESEKRITQILESQSSAVDVESPVSNSDIKSKLQQLTEAEKRIENIFINKANDELTKETSTNVSDVDVDLTSDKKIDDPEESRRNDTSEKITEGYLAPVLNNTKQEKSEEIPTSNRLLSPHSYILTEGSPHDIPDSVTRVIIPDRIPSPDLDSLQIELDDEQLRSTLTSSTEEHQSKEAVVQSEEAFGEPVKNVQVETSIVEDDFIRGIKETHDLIIPRKDLDLIKEERERDVNEVEVIDSEDEKVLKVVTTSLEEILEKDEVEYVTNEEVQKAIVISNVEGSKEEAADLSADVLNPVEYESTDETKETSITDALVENTEVVENSLDIEETTERSAESTNEIKETSIATDRSTLSFDPAIPVVPELNLDSLPDLTISSFNVTDDDQRDENKSKRSTSSENLLSSDSAKYHLSLDHKIIQEKNLIDDHQSENSTTIKTTESHEKPINEDIRESIDQQKQGDISSTEALEKVDNNVLEHKEELDHRIVENIVSASESKDETTENFVVKDEMEKQIISLTNVDENIQKHDTTKNMVSKEEKIKDNENNKTLEEKETEIEIKKDVLEDKKVEQDNTSENLLNDENTIEQIEIIESEKIKEENVEFENEKSEKFEEIIDDASKHSVKQELTTKNKEVEIISDAKSNESPETEVTEQSFVSEKVKISDEISVNTIGEIREKEEQNNNASATQNVTLTHKDDDAKSHSRQVDATEEIIEQNRLGVIDNDESSQLADSPRVSSQCTSTARLDSDEPSIKTNTEAHAQQSNQSEDANATRDEKQTIVEMKSSNHEVPAAEAEDRTEQPEEKKHYHIYVPEMSTSKDISSSSDSSTFMSAATKIQAGVRGFLTRRRLQSTQRRSSTLDSVPSIQESFAVENAEGEGAPTAATSSLLQLPMQMSEAKARKKLRREDAVQRTTLSVENAFAENQLQHTGEFHDCIPLPVFDSEALSLKLDRASAPSTHASEGSEDKSKGVAAREQLLEKILLERGPAPFVDLLLIPADAETMLQSRYLNFITSVEDVANELFSDPLLLPETSKGLIIEEITSLDENKFNELTSTTENQSTVSKESSEQTQEQTQEQTENESSVAGEMSAEASAAAKEEKEEALSLTSDVSMNIDEVLDLGEEDADLPKTNRLLSRLTGVDPPRSSSVSQESHLSEQERTRSPVTMMQIAPKSVEEKSDKSEKSSHSPELVTTKEDTSAEEKEQESPTGTKSNEPDASSS